MGVEVRKRSVFERWYFEIMMIDLYICMRGAVVTTRFYGLEHFPIIGERECVCGRI